MNLIALILLIGFGETTLIGTKPPEFDRVTWLTDHPVRLSDLYGKVVLVRWWTAPGCSYCAASAPALNGFVDEFGSKGLVVIGLYHHKSNDSLTQDFVEEQVHSLGLRFPIGIDNDWNNLQRWWLNGGNRDWTSVSFLLDRNGFIRYIHPGGAYSTEATESYPSAQADYRTLRAHIERLLGGHGETRK